jgi:hypothetical protein
MTKPFFYSAILSDTCVIMICVKYKHWNGNLSCIILSFHQYMYSESYKTPLKFCYKSSKAGSVQFKLQKHI